MGQQQQVCQAVVPAPAQHAGQHHFGGALLRRRHHAQFGVGLHLYLMDVVAHLALRVGGLEGRQRGLVDAVEVAQRHGGH